MSLQKEQPREDREIWIRTGKVTKENSINNRGVITLEEEKSVKTKKTRFVATNYTSYTAKASRVEIA